MIALKCIARAITSNAVLPASKCFRLNTNREYAQDIWIPFFAMKWRKLVLVNSYLFLTKRQQINEEQNPVLQLLWNNKWQTLVVSRKSYLIPGRKHLDQAFCFELNEQRQQQLLVYLYWQSSSPYRLYMVPTAPRLRSRIPLSRCSDRYEKLQLKVPALHSAPAFYLEKRDVTGCFCSPNGVIFHESCKQQRLIICKELVSWTKWQ